MPYLPVNAECAAQALAALCEGTEADIRSCLNTLQFLSRRCQHVRLGDVQSAAAGRKDVTRSAFSLWQRLLCERVRSRICGQRYCEVDDDVMLTCCSVVYTSPARVKSTSLLQCMRQLLAELFCWLLQFINALSAPCCDQA